MGSSFATLARSQGDVPLVAATPVQDLRFRANDLRADAKLTARAPGLAGRKPARAVLGVVVKAAQAA